jgi:hypothetical protein
MRKLLAFAFVLVCLAWLPTGGVIVHRFWFHTSKATNSDHKPYIRVEVQTASTLRGVPYVIQTVTDDVPFGLRLFYESRNVVKEPRLSVQDLSIVFSDGTKTELLDRIEAIVSPKPDEHWHLTSTGARRSFPILSHEINLPECINKRTMFVVRFRGKLLSNGHIVETFDATFEFNPRHEVEILTTWRWLFS